MKHDFNLEINRRNTECKKYEAASYPEDVIPMWIADTDFATPVEISQALKDRMDHSCFGYPANQEEFESSAARWMRDRHSWDVKPEWVKYGQGVMPFIKFAIDAFTAPGDKVIIQTPVYPPFHALVINNGRQLVANPLVKGENLHYTMDLDDLEQKLKDARTKLLLLCSPHNPVMRAWTKEELTAVGDLCLKYGVFIVVDEIHCDLTYKGFHHVSFGTLGERYYNNSMVLINPSKTFNIAGFRVGAAIIPETTARDKIETAIVNNKAYGRTIFGNIAFVTAYTKCDYYADELMEYLEENKNFMVEFLQTRVPKIKVGNPEATYLIWLDCSDLGMNQSKLKAFFRENVKLGLNDGATFGPNGVGFMRMNIACTKKTLKEALERLEAEVNKL